MIGALKGTLVNVEGNIGLIETTGGVMYEAYVTTSFLSHTSVGSLVVLLTYLQVRDDALILFGFENKDEQRMFKLLLTVSGVGPKTAFHIISNTVSSELFDAVKQNDVTYFTKIPGLGKKTAMKVILELSQKIKTEFKFDSMQISDDDQTVIDALVSLGYQVADAKKIFSKLPKQLSVEDKIKEALKNK
jgi:Holliday junction DNA helicase RuvA